MKPKSLHFHRQSRDYAASKKICADCDLREKCTGMLNNYRKAIELGADISLVIEPMNALKSEKQTLEETNRELVARLENQPNPEAFKFTKKAYDNFMEMVKTFSTWASVDNLRLFLQRFIQEIIVYPDDISMIYVPPFIDRFNDSGPNNPYTC